MPLLNATLPNLNRSLSTNARTTVRRGPATTPIRSCSSSFPPNTSRDSVPDSRENTASPSANFTVTEERAEKVDFALPYMNVALGVVSPDSRVITDLSQIGADDEIIVISGTTAEDYLRKNNPEIKLRKFDTYATAKSALENGIGVAWANDNTEVIAFAIEFEGYTVGIPSLGSQDTIAPAVSKGNETLLNWLNDEIRSLADEQFFHKDYEATLVEIYGLDYEESLVLEGGGLTD